MNKTFGSAIYSLQRSLIKIQEQNDTILIQLPNGKNIVLPVDDVNLVGHEIQFYRLSDHHKDEINGSISAKSTLLNSEFKGLHEIVGEERIPMKRSSAWSNHSDFNPSKRFQITPSNRFVQEMGSNVFDNFESNDVNGMTAKWNNVIFVPKDAIHVKFNRIHMNSKQVNISVYNQMVASLSNQTMSKREMTDSCMRLTTVNMLYISVPNKYEALLATYFALFEQNLHFLAKTTPSGNNKWSLYDHWEEMSTMEVVIPTASLEYNQTFLSDCLLTRDDPTGISEPLQTTKQYWDFQIPLILKRKEIVGSNEEILKNYREGTYHMYQETQTIKITATSRNRYISTSPPFELDELERAVKTLVEDRMHEDNIYTSLERMVAFVARNCENELLIKIVKKLTKGRLVHFYDPGLRRLFDKKSPRLKDIIPVHTSDMIKLITTELQQERQLGLFAQTQYEAWTAFFGKCSHKPVFNNSAYIISLAVTRRGPFKKRAGEAPGDLSDDEEEEEGFLKKVAFAPFRVVNNLARNFGEGVRGVRRIGDTLDQMKATMISSLDGTGMRRVADCLRTIDMSSFQGVLSSAKMLVNYWFADFVKKIGELFGVEIERTIDATTLLFYYLIWIGTENRTLRLMLIVDVCTQLGIVDFVMSYAKAVAAAFARLFTKPKADEAAFQEALRKLESVGQQKKAELKIIAGEEKKKNETTTEIEDSETWLTTLQGMFESATVPMLGVAGTILISMLGLTPFKSKDGCFGEKVVLAMKNVSFLSLGLLAIPKIFSNIVGVITAVVEYAKEMVCKDYQSERTLQLQVEEWLKKATYTENASKSMFVSNFQSILDYLQCYGEMKELQKKTIGKLNPTLATEFRTRCNIMDNLLPTARSASTLVLGQREIFHVQLWSKQFGVGKTDAALSLLRSVETTLTAEIDEMRKALGLKNQDRSKAFNNIYPMNDTLKHNDLYYGQIYGYSDEEFIFKNPDADTIISKMTMLSGNPQISKQAALTDKGRLFELQVLLSNTNNAYAPIDNMFAIAALHRRRILVKVDIKQEFQKKGPNGVSLDEGKLTEAASQPNFSRANSDHLEFTVMDSVEERILEPGLTNLSFSQLKLWISAKLKEHYAKEEVRLFSRNPTIAQMRHEFGQLVNDMTVAYGGGVTSDVTPSQIRDNLASLKRFRTEGKPFKPSKSWLFGKDGKRLETPEQLKTLEAQAHATVSDFEEVLKMKEEYGEASCTTRSLDSVMKTFAFSSGRVYLVDSGNQHPVFKGPVEMSRLKWDKLQSKVYYDPELDGEGEAIIPPGLLSWLCTCEGAYNPRDLEQIKKIEMMKVNNRKWTKVFKEELLNLHNSTCRATRSLVNWVKNKIMTPLFESILIGISLAIACVVMFFALAMIGNLLSPIQRSYNSKDDKATLFKRSYEESCDQEVDLAKKSIYGIIVKHSNGSTSRGMAVGVQGSVFLINRHTLHDIEEKEVFVYDHNIGQVGTNGVKKYAITKGDISPIPNCDAVLIDIRGFRPVRQVLKHFVNERDLEDGMKNFSSGRYEYITHDVVKQPTAVNNFQDGEYRTYSSGFHHGFIGHYSDHARTIRIGMSEEPKDGYSGAITIHENPKIQRKFIGILLANDVAGGVYVGVISQEQIVKAMSKFAPSSLLPLAHPSLISLRCDHRLYDTFDLKEELYKSNLHTQAVSQSSGYQKSPIFGVMDVESEPAIQHANDRRIQPGKRHFLSVSLNKTNGYHEPFLSNEEERFAKAFLRSTYIKHIPQLNTIRVYTTKEAITGVKQMGSTSINTKTSAGLPYKLEKGCKGKSPFISFDPYQKSWMIQNRVYDDVDYYEQCYNTGMMPSPLKLEFRKKELVAPSKIEDPKTRTVATGNMICQIIYDKNFKDLFRLTKNVWDQGGSSPFALGVDPERHWDQIASHLKYHNNIIDFDVKAWEEKVCLKLLLLTADVKIKLICDAYKSRGEAPPKIREIVEGLAVDYTDTYVVFEDIIYRKRNGLLSGHPGTFMENSEIHEVILAVAVFRLLKRKMPACANIGFIQEHVRSIKAADDIQIGVSNMLRQMMTAEELVQEYKNLGFEVTSADKKSEIRYKHITESQFLKHGYKKTDSGYIAVPNRSIINQLFNWMRTETALTEHEQFHVNIENAFRFLFWRGEEEYESTREKINVALMAHNFQWPYDHKMMGNHIEMHINESKSTAFSQIPQEEDDDYYN